MAKSKSGDSVPNKHLYTRISYLHQAAVYLQTVDLDKQPKDVRESGAHHAPGHPERGSTGKNMARHLVGNLRAVSRKALIKSTPGMKQTFCKYCDTLLIEGDTCSTTVENPSKGGKKPWADIMVMQCRSCMNVKRFPMGCSRQKKRSQRMAGKAAQLETERPDQVG